MNLRPIVLCTALLFGCSSTTSSGGGGFVSGDAKIGDSAVSSGDSKGGDSGGSDGKISDVDASKSDSTDTSKSDAKIDSTDSSDVSLADKIAACWQDKCSSDIDKCKNSATCASVITCVYACPKTDSVCPNKCADPLKDDLAAAGIFANLAKCAKSNCNFSSLPDKTCGNGKCEGDEIEFCSMDCDTTISALADCTTGKCSADSCLLNATCNKALNCVLECTDPSCFSGCEPTSEPAKGYWDAVWGCVQIDCSVYLPVGG